MLGFCKVSKTINAIEPNGDRKNKISLLSNLIEITNKKYKIIAISRPNKKKRLK